MQRSLTRTLVVTVMLGPPCKQTLPNKLSNLLLVYQNYIKRCVHLDRREWETFVLIDGKEMSCKIKEGEPPFITTNKLVYNSIITGEICRHRPLEKYVQYHTTITVLNPVSRSLYIARKRETKGEALTSVHGSMLYSSR